MSQTARKKGKRTLARRAHQKGTRPKCTDQRDVTMRTNSRSTPVSRVNATNTTTTVDTVSPHVEETNTLTGEQLAALLGPVTEAQVPALLTALSRSTTPETVTWTEVTSQDAKQLCAQLKDALGEMPTTEARQQALSAVAALHKMLFLDHRRMLPAKQEIYGLIGDAVSPPFELCLELLHGLWPLLSAQANINNTKVTSPWDSIRHLGLCAELIPRTFPLKREKDAMHFIGFYEATPDTVLRKFVGQHYPPKPCSYDIAHQAWSAACIFAESIRGDLNLDSAFSLLAASSAKPTPHDKKAFCFVNDTLDSFPTLNTKANTSSSVLAFGSDLFSSDSGRISSTVTTVTLQSMHEDGTSLLPLSVVSFLLCTGTVLESCDLRKALANESDDFAFIWSNIHAPFGLFSFELSPSTLVPITKLQKFIRKRLNQ